MPKKEKNQTKKTVQKSNRGITLIALVVTIVVLLILAGISINAIFGNSSIVNKAQEAAFKQEVSAMKESQLLNSLLVELKDNNTTNTLPIRTQMEGYWTYQSNCIKASNFIINLTPALEEEKAILNQLLQLQPNSNLHIEVMNELLNELERLVNDSRMGEIKLLNQTQSLKVYYDKNSYEEILLEDFSPNALHLNIEVESQEFLTNLQNAINKIDQKLEQLAQKNTYFENKATELEKKAEELEKYVSLDNIEPEEPEEKGELETQKIENINNCLATIENALEITLNNLKKLDETYQILNRMREIAGLRMQEDFLEEEISASQDELNTLKDSINIAVSGIQNANQTLVIGLDGESIEINIENCYTDALGEDNTPLLIDITTKESAQKAIASIEYAVTKIDIERVKLGCKMNLVENIQNYYNAIKEIYLTQIKDEEYKNMHLANEGITIIQNRIIRAQELIVLAINAYHEAAWQVENYKLEFKDNLYTIDFIVRQAKSKDGIYLLNGQWKDYVQCTLEQLGIANIEPKEENISVLENAHKISSRIRGKVEAQLGRREHTLNYLSGIKKVQENNTLDKETKSVKLALVGIKEIESCLNSLRYYMIENSLDLCDNFDREIMSYSIEELLAEIDVIANSTINQENIHLLNGEYDSSINVTRSNLGINNINNNSTQNARRGNKQIGKCYYQCSKTKKKIRTKNRN